MDTVEKDRDLQRVLREREWHVREGEAEELFRMAAPLGPSDLARLQKEVAVFHVRPGAGVAAADERRLKDYSVFVIFIGDLRKEPTADPLVKVVEKLGAAAFFRSDLCPQFNQPYVGYYADEDDGKSLESYAFSTDPLSEHLRARSERRSHFLRERAYRMRKVASRFESVQKGADRLDKPALRQFYNLVKDNPIAGPLFKAFRLVDAINAGTRRDGRQAVVVVDMHLTEALALAALYNPRRLGSGQVYSSAGRDIDYIRGKVSGITGCSNGDMLIVDSLDGSLVDKLCAEFHVVH